jgi:hypothetical protein
MNRRVHKLTIAPMLLTLLASCASPSRQQEATTVKEPAYRSAHPLYFRIAFGSSRGPSMLGVLDESEGTGKGYSVAYIDEGMNNDLASAAPKKFRLVLDPQRLTPWEPKFSFMGPLGAKGKAEYTLDLYSLADTKGPATPRQDYECRWSLKAADWNYSFAGAKVRLLGSATDALRVEPTLLGGKWAWEIGCRPENGKILLSAVLTDESGNWLTDLTASEKRITPVLTLFKEREKAFEQKMEFG